MKIRCILLMFMCISQFAYAQYKNLFSLDNGNITVYQDFIGLDLSNRNPQIFPTYEYESYDITSSNEQDRYTLKIGGAAKRQSSTGTYDNIKILYQGKTILDVDGYDPLFTVKSLTMNKSDKNRFIHVPLSDTCFALFFGGWLYGMDNAPEMIVIIVNNGQARVVYDNYAYAFKYSQPPCFSLEFVDDISELFEYDSPYKGTINDSFLNSRTKHKIWREGNMLKYKSWK